MDYKSLYDRNYYETYSIGEQTTSYKESVRLKSFMEHVADHIIKTLRPVTILDVGCAMGLLVAALRDRGVQAYGIDVSEYAVSQVRDDIKPYCKVCSALDPLPEDFPKIYDLVTNIEVAEHLYEEDGKQLIRNLCRYSDHVLFSSTPDDFAEKTHFNVQQPEYWAKLFWSNGFFHDLQKDVSFISPQAMLFFKKELSVDQIVEHYERGLRSAFKILQDQIKDTKTVNEKLIEGNQFLETRNKSFKKDITRISTSVVNKKHEISVLKRKLVEQKEQYADIIFEKEKEIQKISCQWRLKYDQCKFELDTIRNSRGFHFLCRLYHIRDTVLPMGSKRRSFIKFMVRVLKSFRLRYIKKACRYIKKNGLRKFRHKITDLMLDRSTLDMASRYELWIRLNEPGREELKLQRSSVFPYQPKISIVIPLYNTPIIFLKELIDSIIRQTYANWELCMADGNSENRLQIQDVVADCHNQKIRLKLCDRNEGISGNTNAAITEATGDFIAFMDHDDLLPEFALYEIVKCINACDSADFIYSDDDRIDKSGKIRSNPCFKPDFSPDRLRCCNYIGHLTVVKKSLFDKVGPLRSEYDGSQDHDFALRATEQAVRIEHIPKILYHWRVHENSVVQNGDSKPYATTSAIKAISAHLERVGLKGTVSKGLIPFSYRINYQILTQEKISIIIPTMDHIGELDNCVRSIFEKTTYPNYEILLIENNSKNPQTFQYYNKIRSSRVKIYNWRKPGFNYSALINFGVRYATGKYIVTLNNDTEIITPQWLEEMLMFAQRDDVGMVSPKLYYPDNTIWNAGVVLHRQASVTLLSNKEPRNSAGYYGQAMIVQNFSALAGACVMFRKSLYLEVGGCDEIHFPVAHNDMDLSLKMVQRGKHLVFTPYAELYHYESKSRGSDMVGKNLERFIKENSDFLIKWQDYLKDGDPFYNINFQAGYPAFQIRTDKVQYKY